MSVAATDRELEALPPLGEVHLTGEERLYVRNAVRGWAAEHPDSEADIAFRDAILEKLAVPLLDRGLVQ